MYFCERNNQQIEPKIPNYLPVHRREVVTLTLWCVMTVLLLIFATEFVVLNRCG